MTAKGDFMPELDTGTGQVIENDEQGAPSSSGALSDQERWIQEVEEQFEQASAAASEEEPEEEPQAEPDEQDEASVGEETQTTNDWVSIIREQPHRINEVPARERGAVIQQIREDDNRSAQEIAQQQAQRARQEAEQALQQRQQMNEFVGRVDQFRRTDPDGFDYWEKANPQEAQQYYAAKGQLYAQPQPANPFVEAATQMLQGLPQETISELQKRHQQDNRYTEDAKGLQRLTADINELTRQSSSRQKAAESRKSVPKADPSPPSQPKGKLSKKDIDSKSVKELMELEEKGEDLLSAL